MSERYDDPYPIQIGEIDSIPLVWAALPTLPTAYLIFRRGWADESFTGRGLTHLLEHVVNPWPDRPRVGSSATVFEYHTVFRAEGALEEIEPHLLQLCANLRDPPEDRIEPERTRCLIEASGGPSWTADLLEERYGYGGLGLAGRREYGLQFAGADALRELTAGWFTGGNAALATSFEPPATWRIPLVEGPRQAIAHVDPRPGRTEPGFIPGELLGISYVAGVTSLDRLVHRTLLDRLWIELRGQGLSYTITSSTRFESARTRFRTVLADVHEESHAPSRDAFLRTLDSLVRDGLRADQLDDTLEELAVSLADPLDAWQITSLTAQEALLGVETEPRARAIRRYRVLGRDVGPAVASVLDRAVIMQPECLHAPPGIERTRMSYKDEPVDGTRFVAWAEAPVEDDEATAIIVGPSGVSLIDGAGDVLTVPFDRCAGIVLGGSGRITVNHEDGRWEDFAPSWFEQGPALVDLLHDRVGDRFVRAGLGSHRWERLEELANERLLVRDARRMDLSALQSAMLRHESVTELAFSSYEGRVGLLATTSLRLLWVRAPRAEDTAFGWRAHWEDIAHLETEEGDEGPTMIATTERRVVRLAAINPPGAAASLISRALSEWDDARAEIAPAT